MARKLRITDNVLMQPVGIVSDPVVLKDFISGSGVAPLVVKIAATHSGLVTGNNTFYLPDKMRKGTDTWISQYPKPVLVHHELNNDAVGRIVRAEYVDLAPDQVSVFKDAVVRSNLNNFKAGLLTKQSELKFIKDILVKSEVLKDKNYQGLGFIQLIAAITDPDAIQKIKDGRYLTGSVSASTDAAVCSICESDWIIDGRCDHSPGEIYDGIPAFLIAGNFEYEEYSWVNRPADVHSSVMELVSDGICERIGKTKVTDALKVNSHAARMMLISAHDSLHYQWDWKIYSAQKDATPSAPTTSPDAVPPPKDIYDLHEQLHKEAKEQGIDGSLVLGALDSVLPKDLWPPMPAYESTEDSSKEKVMKTEVKDEQKKDETVSETVKDEATVETFTQFSDSTSEDLEVKFNEIDLAAENISDEQSDLIYELMLRELGDSTEVADAKLSTEKRKKLASSTFCGPGRSFPVPDCAHVTAARRLIGRYKGPGDKSAILACVSRKAKALGCEDTKDAVVENPVVDQKVEDKTACETCEAKLAKAEAATKDAITALSTKEAETSKLADQLSALREEFRYLHADIANMEDELIAAKLELRTFKASRAVDMKRLSGVEVKDTKLELANLLKLEDKLLDAQALSVDIEKIIDKLNSGLTNTSPDTTTIVDPSPVSATISDDEKASSETVRKTYAYLLETAGPKKANSYLARMQREGYLKD